eukprot:TRINITY_DN6371_c0_g1_i4.p2 TRINITY_DN6371_c0_g1~~TRINITY_DN6371_c0_g1_i4.p2  ORF type:complete len:370 (-),score=20.13 TRINITY_DN6371_c0_g1_i4:403-1512(-)
MVHCMVTFTYLISSLLSQAAFSRSRFLPILGLNQTVTCWYVLKCINYVGIIQNTLQTTNMQFRCANCSSRLVVNDGDSASMFKLSTKVAPTPDTSYSLVLDLEEAKLKHRIEESRQGGEGHVHVQYDEQTDLGSTPSKAQTLARIFELASDDSLIDHPLCADCAGQVRRELEYRTTEVQHEIEDYQCALLQLAKESEEDPSLEQQEFEKEIAGLDAQIQIEQAKVMDLDSELSKLNTQMAMLKESSNQLDTVEQQYWLNYNRLYESLHHQLEEKDRLSSKLFRSEELLRYLKQTDVYNDVFQIWHEGVFGTISGLRLGQTREEPVEWEEINAAWGQALLLLQTLASDCKFEFSQYRLYALFNKNPKSNR